VGYVPFVLALEQVLFVHVLARALESKVLGASGDGDALVIQNLI
jgi:hypothetical protein